MTFVYHKIIPRSLLFSRTVFCGKESLFYRNQYCHSSITPSKYSRNQKILLFKSKNSTKEQFHCLSSSPKPSGKNIQVLTVPLLALFIAIWAFLYRGFNSSHQSNKKQENEQAYVSRVELLHKEKEARKSAAV